MRQHASRSQLPAPPSYARPPGLTRYEPRSDEVGEVSQQRRLRPRANDLLDDLPVLEDAHGRDIHDPVALGDDRVLVDVELHDVNLLAVLGRDLLKHGGDLAARSTPFGPVVNDDRLGSLQYLGLEGRVGHCLGCAHFWDFPSSVRCCLPRWQTLFVARLRTAYAISQPAWSFMRGARPASAPRRWRRHNLCPLP